MMASPKSYLIGLVPVLFLISLSAVVDDSNALPSMSCIRGYFSNIKDYIISKSEVIQEFQSSMNIVKGRYETMKNSSAFNGTDPVECEKIFKELALEELRSLRTRLESKADEQRLAHEAELNKLPQVDEMGVCSRGSQYSDEIQEPAWDPDIELDEDEELRLLEELEELERMSKDEALMGWSQEAMDDVKRRTQEILSDLLDNEVRRLALAVVSAYLSGGTLGPILAPIIASMQTKVLDYLMNCVLDVLTHLSGGRTPQEDLAISAASMQAAAIAY